MMPQNKRESFIFTIMMCFFMAFCMGLYALSKEIGIGLEALKISWLSFPITYVVAVAFKWYVASPCAKKMAGAILAKQNHFKLRKMLAMPLSMTVFMVLGMSFYGAIILCLLHSNWNEILKDYIIGIPFNFIFALPLQLLIAGPVIRFLFRKVFPVGTVLDQAQIQ